jgi:iron-sulfur cluster repair protein YtfE (RIC family)
MFDIWLKRNREIVDEIIKESNLKEITKKKLDAYMLTDEFAEFLDNTLKNEIKKIIEEYAEFYMISDGGWNEIADKIRQIVREHNDK